MRGRNSQISIQLNRLMELRNRRSGGRQVAYFTEACTRKGVKLFQKGNMSPNCMCQFVKAYKLKRDAGQFPRALPMSAFGKVSASNIHKRAAALGGLNQLRWAQFQRSKQKVQIVDHGIQNMGAAIQPRRLIEILSKVVDEA